jgi:hypothetical protein
MIYISSKKTMAKSKHTSKRVASEASKLLRTSPSKIVRSVAGSDLAQRKHHKRKGK